MNTPTSQSQPSNSRTKVELLHQKNSTEPRGKRKKLLLFKHLHGLKTAQKHRQPNTQFSRLKTQPRKQALNAVSTPYTEKNSHQQQKKHGNLSLKAKKTAVPPLPTGEYTPSDSNTIRKTYMLESLA